MPRFWRFVEHSLQPYEFGFNHPGQEEYDEMAFPDGFVAEVEAFLSETALDEVLGLCAIGEAEVMGRIEKNRGRVNFTVPPVGMPVAGNGEVDIAAIPEHRVSVWSFDCKSGLRDSTLKLARACWVCPRH